MEGEDEGVRSRQHLILQLLLVIAAFIWQTRIGCYGNGLIDIEEEPKILPKVFDNKGRALSETAVIGNLLSISLKILCIFSKSSLKNWKIIYHADFFLFYVYSHENHNNQIETDVP